MVFNEPSSSIPIKCIVCRTNIPVSVIERQLDPDRLMTLITILAALDGVDEAKLKLIAELEEEERADEASRQMALQMMARDDASRRYGVSLRRHKLWSEGSFTSFRSGDPPVLVAPLSLWIWLK
jgi:hypothetical protein